jgi:hypothetical protein
MKGTFGGELHVTHEFPPDELVGWVQVRVEDQATENPLVIASIAYGRTSEEGATAALEIGHSPDDLRRIPLIDGIGPSPALAAKVRLGKPNTLAAVKHFNPARNGNELDGEIGEAFCLPDRPWPQPGNWAVGNDQIIGTLKEGLAGHGAEGLYPVMYYLLAQMCREQDQLVDPTMHEMTLIEKALMDYRYRELLKAQSLDLQLKDRLDNYSASEHSSIMNDFITSRQTVALTEANAAEAAKLSTYNNGYMCQPVGFGHGHRRPPFMDARARTDKEAFGRELTKLANHDYGDTITEVVRELTELYFRVENAANVLGRVSLLADKEQVKIDDDELVSALYKDAMQRMGEIRRMRPFDPEDGFFIG